jgi:hypothetical protein
MTERTLSITNQKRKSLYENEEIYEKDLGKFNVTLLYLN